MATVLLTLYIISVSGGCKPHDNGLIRVKNLVMGESLGSILGMTHFVPLT